MQPRNSTGDNFFAWDGDTLVVNILGKPSAGCDAIGKPKGNQLKVSVTAAPVRGKATDHMLRFLAPHFGVVPMVLGDASRLSPHRRFRNARSDDRGSTGRLSPHRRFRKYHESCYPSP
ncbi:MAG: DUF167 family protein [Methylophilaceae bacterium]